MKKVKCPECGKTAEPMKGQKIYCTGKYSKEAVQHKKAMLMK